MTLLAPGFFYAALAVAAAVVALHFLVTRQPRAGVLPTARFVPDLPATATVRATRPSDLLLLLLRVLLVLLAGAALARPVLTPARRAEARVILVDASRAVRNAGELRDGARSVYREGDAVVVFDSAARVVTGRVADSLRVLEPSRRTGSLSAALIGALRAASTLRASADSLELVIVSPLAADELDAATASIRTLWTGRARLLRIGGESAAAAGVAATAASPTQMEIRSSPGDPLAIAVTRTRRDALASALIMRDADTAFASAPATAPSTASATASATASTTATNRALVHWPLAGRPRGAVPRASSDSIGGVVAGDALVVAPFERRWSYPRDSLRGARVIARWIDGEPAAAEWVRESSCIRSVAISVAAVGDLVIRDDFVAMVGSLGRTCEGATASAPMSPADLAMLTGTGGRVSRDNFQSRPDVHSSLAPWLFGAAIALAFVELFLRARRRDVAVSADQRRTTGMAA